MYFRILPLEPKSKPLKYNRTATSVTCVWIALGKQQLRHRRPGFAASIVAETR